MVACRALAGKESLPQERRPFDGASIFLSSQTLRALPAEPLKPSSQAGLWYHVSHRPQGGTNERRVLYMSNANLASLGEIANAFITRNPAPRDATFQLELQRFVRWCGRDGPISELTPRKIESYAESRRADSIKTLEPIKALLEYARKDGLTATNLGIHLRVKRGGPRPKGGRPLQPDPRVLITKEGYDRVQGELEGFKNKRVLVALDIQRAMADKDFRENAPLDAAREQQGFLEARIRELEQAIRLAEIVGEVTAEEATAAERSRLGSRIVVQDLADGQELHYLLVGPREVDLDQGKISIDSPVGKAFLNRSAGEVVEVQAPVGALRYRIERVGR